MLTQTELALFVDKARELMNGNRHHVAFTYDEPSDFFWEVYGQINGKVAA